MEARDGKLPGYEPPQGIHRRGTIGGQPLRRKYQVDKREIEDAALGRREAWPRHRLADVLAQLAEEHFVARVERLIYS